MYPKSDSPEELVVVSMRPNPKPDEILALSPRQRDVTCQFEQTKLRSAG